LTEVRAIPGTSPNQLSNESSTSRIARRVGLLRVFKGIHGGDQLGRLHAEAATGAPRNNPDHFLHGNQVTAARWAILLVDQGLGPPIDNIVSDNEYRINNG